jgi:hypothetical protein
MRPRHDSALTKQFVEGTTSMSAGEVARELMATHYIYTHTLYGEMMEDFMRAVAKRLRNMYKLSWKATWEIVPAYASNALKLIMLLRTGQRIPERLPDDGE